VIPDFRPPDNLRLAVCPLYTRFVDLHEAVATIRRVTVERIYEGYPAIRSGVS
jgi:kynureninase